MNKKTGVLFALTVAVAFLTGCCVTVYAVRFSRIRIARTADAELTDKLEEAVRIIDDYYIGDYNPDELADMAISAMVYSLGDPWSYYITSDELGKFLEISDNEYKGIGVIIERSADGEFMFSRVYENSPAQKAGVESQSVLIAVDERTTTGMTIDEVTEAIEDCIDSGTVCITVETPGGETRQFEIVPGYVEIDPVEYKMLDCDVGLVSIKNFESKSAEQFIGAVDALVEMGARGMIFDVRNNPGGQLPELLKMLDHILPEGDLFISRDSFGNEKREHSDAGCISLPMAVLINSDSYSAAEFFAAALDDYGWAVTVGETTTGKGRAQVTLGLKDGSAIHISDMEYFTPSGKSLAESGLEPDIAVDMDEKDKVRLYVGALPYEDDAQLLKAVEAVCTGFEKAG